MKELRLRSMRLWICMIPLLFVVNLLNAQTRSITGTVTDATDGSLLPAVTVNVKGTATSAMTDENGKFSIQAGQNAKVLVFSFVGYKQVEVTIGASNTVNVALDNEAQALDDIVVIGYGTAKKSDLTGAVATVRAEKLMDMPVPNITQALQGKVAGVEVAVNSNAPGAGAKVRIRGLGSINSNLDPLYVVDGVVGVNGNSLNPNDIASIEILKDASSTAIYGSRGANGVIMVTTKRGRAGATRVTYDGNVNVAELNRSVPVLDANEFVQVYNQMYANGQKYDPDGQVQTPVKALNHANYPLLFDANDRPIYNTNWEKEVYKPATSHNHNLTFQGGTDKTLYSASLGYLDQNGIMTTSNFKRYSARFTLDNEVNRWLKVGGNLNIIRTNQRAVHESNGALNVPRMISEALPILPVKYPDGTWAGNSNITGMEGGANPVHIANNRYTLNNNFQTLGNTYLLFKLAKNLEFKSDFGFDLSTLKSNFYSASDLHNLSMNQGGVANINSYHNLYWQSENYLNWNKEFNNGHRMTAMVGASWQQFSYERLRAETQNLIDDFFEWHNLNAGSLRSASESDDYKWAMNSYFARITYNINNKYLFTATGRYDGSSKFGVNNQYAFFPSVGAAWRISEEDFLKDNSIISDLKLRTSFGITGNSEIGVARSKAQIGVAQTVLNGQNTSSLLPNYLGNPNLKWEATQQTDIGLELGLFNNRVVLNADYYVRNTNDLLLQTPIPWSSGMNTNNVYINVGSVRNRGVELSLNTVNVQTRDFTWSTNFIFSANRNKITKLREGNADIFPGPNFLGQNNILRVGESIGTFWGRTRLGTYGEHEAAEAALQGLKPGDRKYLLNADGSENYSVIGRSIPKWTGNFSSTINYKSWDFTFDIRFVQGINTAANFKHSVEDRQGIANSLKTVLNGWTPQNQNTMISEIRPYLFAQDSKFDTWWVEDGSFIRGQNFMLGYVLPGDLTERLKINRMRFYVSVQNLFLITNYTGYDPEVDTFNTGYGSNSAFSQNIDFFAYPRPRVWNLGVNVNF